MKERGILYTPDNIRAILEGRKAQTRRLKGLEEINKSPFAWICKAFADGVAHFFHKAHMSRGGSAIRCPYGVVGDRLYVKEGFAYCTDRMGAPSGYAYRLDKDSDHEWKSPLFMPKAAARLWLEITDVRVERLQDISEADAIAEGVKPCGHTSFHVDEHTCSYRDLWDSINEKDGHGWAVNDWVWALSFKRVDP